MRLEMVIIPLEVTSGQNKKRKHGRKGRETRFLWGFLFRKDTEEDDINKTSFFSKHGVPDEDEMMAPTGEPPRGFFQNLWRRFSIWSLTATLLFLAFVGVLAAGVAYMWIPQSLKDVAGYADTVDATDVTAKVRNANGSQVIITEAELNRYLRENCRIRQTGFFSIFAHVQGVAVRVHDGYAEVIIDRIIGVNVHQTTAVYLTFSRVVENGRPVLKVDFQGGPPLFGDMPTGGRIGSLDVPTRHIQVLKPALETLQDCFPELKEEISNHGYLPVFKEGRNGQENRIILIPYTPNS